MAAPFDHIAVLGAGSWGTALSLALAESGRRVTLWGHERDHIEAVARERVNTEYLPGVELGESITAVHDMAETASAPIMLMVPPSNFFADVAARLRDVSPLEDAVLVSCSKGIEAESGRRMSQIISDTLPGHPVAVLSGPSHAEEVGRRLATACVVGCADHDLAERIQETFSVGWFRTYTSTDVAGIELGGAIKNVFAIAAGIVDGLGLGDNAKAGLITRGLTELVRLGTVLGGRRETFMGLSGIGDLMVTCYSEHSRNNRFGRGLGQGKSLDEVAASMGHMVAEGVPNTASVHHVARRAGVETPIIDQVYAVLYEGKPPATALRELLSRHPRPEADEGAESAG